MSPTTSDSCNVLPHRVLALNELAQVNALLDRCTLVAWAPPAARMAEALDFAQLLPPGIALVFTGDNATQPAWCMLTHGDLRALRDRSGLRQVAVEPDPQWAISAAMQQLSETEHVVVVVPPDVSRWQVEFFIRCGEARRDDPHPWDE